MDPLFLVYKTGGKVHEEKELGSGAIIDTFMVCSLN